MEFVEPEDGPGYFRNPLPPDDRLWRHPSEVGASLPVGGPVTTPADSPEGDDSRPSMWLVAAVSAVSAGLLATGMAMVVVGLMGTNDQLRPVVERQMEPRPIDAVSSGGGVVDVAGTARAAIAQLRLEGSSTVVGSGVMFRSDGHLLTTASAVGRAMTVRVVLDSGRELTGRVIGSDPDTDTAVVKVDGGPFPTAVLGHASDLQVGQQAIAIGWPVELIAGEPSVTVGVISGLHRTVRRGDGGMLFDMVQTDARVPTGWPGGALLDSSGSVIGITTSIGTAAGGTGGFGFATPIELARSVADQLIATGRVTRVWLGVQGTDLDWVTAARLEVPGGALVGEVKEGSPAERAGLAGEDVIVGLGGVTVASMGDLVVALRGHQPGDTVDLHVLRENQRMSMAVVLIERPTPA